MAVQNIKNGKDYIVYIDKVTAITGAPPLPTSTDFIPLMCLSSNALNVTINGIDTTSKCTNGWADSIPGDGSWEITADGQAISVAVLDEDIKASADQLFDLATNKTSFWAAIFDPAKSTFRVGVAFISSFAENFNNNESYTFSITLTGRGELYRNAV